MIYMHSAGVGARVYHLDASDHASLEEKCRSRDCNEDQLRKPCSLKCLH